MASYHMVAITIVLITVSNIYGKSHSRQLLTPEEGCGYSKVQTSKIVGGSESKAGAWPWLALLFYEDDYEIFPNCGGSLITSRHVLTAAHCVKYPPVFARLGEHDTRTTIDGLHQDIAVAHVQAHEEYDVFVHDIALIYLIRDVDFNDRISPICLPIFEDLLHRRFVNSNPFIAGWGKLGEDQEMSPVLMQTQVPVITNEMCKSFYKKVNMVADKKQFDDRIVCAGYTKGGKDSCGGDSGGPLMLPLRGKNGKFAFYQIGVVSWGKGCAQPKQPGIYSNIQYYAKWIQSKIF